MWPRWKSARETRQMLPQTRFPPVRKIQNHSGHKIKCLLSDSTSSPGSSPTNLSLCRDGSERTLVTKKSEFGPDGKIFGCWSGQYFSVRPSNSVIKYRLMHTCMVDPTMKMPPHPAAHAHKFICRKYPVFTVPWTCDNNICKQQCIPEREKALHQVTPNVSLF